MPPKLVEFKAAPAPAAFQASKEALQAVRRSLPIYAERDVLIKAVKENKNLIVVGETGSGKTTQLPQYLHEAGLTRFGAIACTQPRRVAAITVAQRVAQEMGVRLGGLVGYTIRFDDTSSRDTKIKYVTDGMLLRELQGDPELRRYSVVVLDEAHERTLNTDILFALLKRLQSGARPDLRIVAMSATLDAEKFSRYFNDAPVALVPGRTHPVDVFYLDDVVHDYVEACVSATMQLHEDRPLDGDVLVFLPGSEDIENAKVAIDERAKLLPAEAPGILTVVLYSALAPEVQLKAFEPTPHGMRKVVLSTNISETSITLSGIKYVIDSGMTKVRQVVHSGTGASGSGTGGDGGGNAGGKKASLALEQLAVQAESRAEAWQRAGRSGRERPGECFRLYPESAFLKLAPTGLPEILRVPLSSVTLQLKALNVQDVQNFDFLDRPQKVALRNALKELIVLGAVSDADGSITPLGREMVRIPLEPAYAKVLLASAEPPAGAFAPCSGEMTTLVAALSADQVFVDTSRARPDIAARAAVARRRFASTEGDMMTVLEAVSHYLMVAEHKRQQWARDHFLHTRNVEMIARIREQLVDELKALGKPIVSCKYRLSSAATAAALTVSAFGSDAMTAVAAGGGAAGGDDDDDGGGSAAAGSGEGGVITERRGGRGGPGQGGSGGGDVGAAVDPLETVRRCLVTGLFSHAAKRQADGSYRTIDNTACHIHPSSVLQTFREVASQAAWNKQVALSRHQDAAVAAGTSNIVSMGGGGGGSAGAGAQGPSGGGSGSVAGARRHPFDCVLYGQLVATSRHYMRDLIVIDFAWLAELAPKGFAAGMHSFGAGAGAFGGFDPAAALAAQRDQQQQKQQQQQRQGGSAVERGGAKAVSMGAGGRTSFSAGAANITRPSAVPASPARPSQHSFAGINRRAAAGASTAGTAGGPPATPAKQEAKGAATAVHQSGGAAVRIRKAPDHDPPSTSSSGAGPAAVAVSAAGPALAAMKDEDIPEEGIPIARPGGGGGGSDTHGAKKHKKHQQQQQLFGQAWLGGGY